MTEFDRPGIHGNAPSTSLKARLIRRVGTETHLAIFWGRCSRNPHSVLHRATALVETDQDRSQVIKQKLLTDYTDECRWPKHCDNCRLPVPQGYFLNTRGDLMNPHYTVRRRRTYNTLRGQPEPGDVYHDELSHVFNGCLYWKNCDDPRGHLVGVAPGGHLIDLIERKRDCDWQEDNLHRCWCIDGVLPDSLSVTKDTYTCGASITIQVPGWTGFLTSGEWRPL